MLSVDLAAAAIELGPAVLGVASLLSRKHRGPKPEPSDLSIPWHSPQNAGALTLLSWHTELSDFRGREREMDRLESWAEGGSPVSVQFLTGRGGAGKSKLAAEFARHLRSRGWAAGFVDLSRSVRFYHKRPGTLLVIDYPEEDPEAVRELLADLAALEGTGRWRVLFLTRRSLDDWRAAIDGARATALVAPNPINLSWVADAAAYALFQSAQTRAAAALGTEPNPLPQDAFNAWLELAPDHRHALFIVALAVHSAVHPQESAVRFTGQEVMDALVERELTRWRRSAQNGGFPDRYALARLLVVAAIMGEVPEQSLPAMVAANVLGSVPGGLPELADRLRELGVMDGATVPAPKPDMMAAAFVVKSMAAKPLLAPAAVWLAIEPDLAGGSARFSRLAYDAEIILGIRQPRLSSWLAEAVRGRSDRCRTLRPIIAEAVLPVGLVEAAVAVWQTLLAAADDEVERAHLLNILSADLSAFGDQDGALAAIRDAMEIYRRLAAANPARFEPDLALSLNNLSNRLSATDDLDGALTAIGEAVAIYQRLAAANPARFEPDLAASLNNLSVHLSESGDRDGALAAIREAVEIQRRLAAANPARFEPDLARSLHNLAVDLSESGDLDGARAARAGAEAILKRLLKENPPDTEPDPA